MATSEGFTNVSKDAGIAGQDQSAIYEAEHSARGIDSNIDFEQTQGAVKYSAKSATDFVNDVESIASNLQANNDVSLSAVTVASLNANEAEAKFTTKQAVGGSTIKKQLDAAKKFQQSM